MLGKPLSPLAPLRSMPIAATALPFAVRLDTDGVILAVHRRLASGAFIEASYPKQRLLAQRSNSKDSPRIAPINVAWSVRKTWPWR